MKRQLNEQVSRIKEMMGLNKNFEQHKKPLKENLTDKFNNMTVYMEKEACKSGYYGFTLYSSNEEWIDICVEVKRENWEKEERQTLEYPGSPGGLSDIDIEVISGVYNLHDENDEGQKRELTDDELKSIEYSEIGKKIYDELMDKISNMGPDRYMEPSYI